MYIMLSWKIGERPHAELLPADPVAVVREVLIEARAGREVEIYLASNDSLTLVYPAPESVTLSASLVGKGLA